MTIERVGDEYPRTPDVVKFLVSDLSVCVCVCVYVCVCVCVCVCAQMSSPTSRSHVLIHTGSMQSKQRFRAYQQEYVIACYWKPLKNLSVKALKKGGTYLMNLVPMHSRFNEVSQTSTREAINVIQLCPSNTAGVLSSSPLMNVHTQMSLYGCILAKLNVKTVGLTG